MLSSDEKYNILHDSAKEIGIDSHIVVADKKSDLHTQAEQMMGNMSHFKNPHKNSYLFMDSVDACFYIYREIACVTFAAKWGAGSKDLSVERFEKAIITINKMLETMQLKINELIN